MAEVLRVDELTVYYHMPAGPVKAVEKVSFSLNRGERMGLVGESGSGKSTIALALMRMIKAPGKIEHGSVVLNGQNLLTLPEEQMRRVRLAHLSLVAQGAMNSLNPVKRVKDQISLALRDHDALPPDRELKALTASLLDRVGLKPQVAEMFPHELSGGMKQRVCIAIAISLQPDVIIADEPTSALDVVVQWQVIDTLRKVQEELGAAVVQIGHDMGLMAQSVERLGVMYAGMLVEIGSTKSMFATPLHPYTQLLIGSLPSLEGRDRLHGIPGLPPSLLNRPGGNCPFHPRCPMVMERCRVEEPAFREVQADHWVACHLYDEVVQQVKVAPVVSVAAAAGGS